MTLQSRLQEGLCRSSRDNAEAHLSRRHDEFGVSRQGGRPDRTLRHREAERTSGRRAQPPTPLINGLGLRAFGDAFASLDADDLQCSTCGAAKPQSRQAHAASSVSSVGQACWIRHFPGPRRAGDELLDAAGHAGLTGESGAAFRPSDTIATDTTLILGAKVVSRWSAEPALLGFPTLLTR